MLALPCDLNYIPKNYFFYHMMGLFLPYDNTHFGALIHLFDLSALFPCNKAL